MTPDQAQAELAAVLANDDGWADGSVLVRRETLATALAVPPTAGAR